MKAILYFFVFGLMCTGVSAQSTAYPQYDANGVRVKPSPAVQENKKPDKGNLTRRNKSGLLINVGTYEVKGDEIEVYKADASGMLHPDKKIKLKSKDEKEIENK